MVEALWEFWFARGHLLEGSQWTAAMLEASAGASVPARAGALTRAGYLALNLGDLKRAAETFDESLELYRELDIGWRVADALRGLGRVRDAQGQHALAVDLFEESL